MTTAQQSSTAFTFAAAAEAQTPLRTGLREGLSRLFLRLLDMQERARQRRRLLALSDRALADLGLSRADAEREAGTSGRM